MTGIAALTASLRERIHRSQVSLRRFARTAGLAEASLRKFMAGGNPTYDTLNRVESALDELDRERSAGGGADDPEHPVPPHSRKQMAACHE